MREIKGNFLSGLFLFLFTIVLCLLTAFKFLSMHKTDAVYPSPGLSSKKMLSKYFPDLKDTRGDTEVYIFNGEEKGGNLLILGGTHPNEPAGFITSFLLVENIRVSQGKIVIVPQANKSGFTHSDPQEGSPQMFSFSTPGGRRFFRYGSRLTNPVDQWPDPTLYINPSGQKLSGTESRNLNRCYPGRKNGTLTEKIAFAVIELIKEEKIDLALDLHEAAPEYPVINSIVFHENSAELAAIALMELQLEGFEIRLESSPKNLRGLSHREWGDSAQVKAILLETANASHGRLKGKTSPSLIIEGKDKNYTRAAQLGRLFVPYPEEGVPLKQRVARHLASIKALISSFRELDSDKKIEVHNMPPSFKVIEKGIGNFLTPPK